MKKYLSTEDNNQIKKRMTDILIKDDMEQYAEVLNKKNSTSKKKISTEEFFRQKGY